MKKHDRMSIGKKIDTDRETRVLLEEVRHEVKTVAEGHGSIISKLEEMDRQFRKNDSEHFKLEMLMESVKSQAGTIDTKATRIERDLDTIKNALLDMSQAAKGHEVRIAKVEEKISAQ